MTNLMPPDGGCWFCHQDNEKEELVLEGEFDTFVHISCLAQKLKDDPGHPEATIMAYLLTKDDIDEITLHEPPREHVAETRKGVTRKVSDACGFELYINVNFYPDSNEPSEIFLTIAKKGSVVSGFTRALAVLISVMLQYGIPWSMIYDKLEKMKFDPQSEQYTSLIDAIAQNVNDIVKGVQT